MAEFGIQLFGCMKEYWRDPEGLLRRLAEMGYRQAEPCVSFGEKPLPFAWQSDGLSLHTGRLKKAGLSLSSCHVFAPDLVKAAPAMAQAAKEYGIRQYVVGFHGPFSPESAEAFAKSCLEVSSVLQKEGVELWLHNNAAEIREKLQGISYYEWILSYCKGALGAQVDTGWTVYGGEDLKDFLTRNEAYVRSIHHKDLQSLEPCPQGPVNLPVGKGVVDTRAAFSFACSHGLGQIVDQDTSLFCLLEDLQQGLSYLEGLL